MAVHEIQLTFLSFVSLQEIKNPTFEQRKTHFHFQLAFFYLNLRVNNKIEILKF